MPFPSFPALPNPPPFPAPPPIPAIPTVPNLLQAFPSSLDFLDQLAPSSSGGATFPNAHLVDMVDNTRLEFQFIPTDANEHKAANYHEHEILGRSTPILAYQGSAATMVTLTLQFFVAPFQSDDTPTLQGIKDHVDWLRSLVYPDYSQGIRPPHPVLLHLGDVIAGIYVATDYNLSIPANVPWEEPRGGPTLAHGYNVKLTLKSTLEIPPDLNDIRGSGNSISSGNTSGSGMGL